MPFGSVDEDLQRRYHRQADPSHFEWQTTAPYFASTEAALLDGVADHAERLLEIGCGEGGNLFHLAGRGTRYGVDFSLAKAAFAQRQKVGHASCASATALPFADGAFDVVLIRDLLHHLSAEPKALSDRLAAVHEAHRVLGRGGRLLVIEPNVLSPLVLLQASLVKAERGLFRSTAGRIRRELESAGFLIEREERRQPLPVGRVLLHPRLGADRLGAHPSIVWLLDGVDRWARRLMPECTWLYLLFHAVKK